MNSFDKVALIEPISVKKLKLLGHLHCSMKKNGQGENHNEGIHPGRSP